MRVNHSKNAWVDGYNRIGAVIEIIPINSKNIEEITIMKGTLTCSFSSLIRICIF